MLFPVRCFTCSKVIGHLWETYKKEITNGEHHLVACHKVGVKRMCCCRMFICHVDIDDTLLMYG